MDPEMFYEKLPAASRARDADNPDIVATCLSHWEATWPFLALCEYASGGVTWHMVCDEVNSAQMAAGWVRDAMVNPRITAIRNTELVIVEYYDRRKDEYFVL